MQPFSYFYIILSIRRTLVFKVRLFEWVNFIHDVQWDSEVMRLDVTLILKVTLRKIVTFLPKTFYQLILTKTATIIINIENCRLFDLSSWRAVRYLSLITEEEATNTSNRVFSQSLPSQVRKVESIRRLFHGGRDCRFYKN